MLLLLFILCINVRSGPVVSPKTRSEAQLVGRELHPVMGDEGVLVTELGC